jgi:type IV pilus assembly protein PilN
MAQINLLPWREELRLERKKEFLTQLGGVAIVAVLSCFLWVKTVDGSIASQRERNQLLKSEISLLQKQVQEIKELKDKKKELESRMKVIQDLEGKRSVIVHFFDELAKKIPEGVYFTEIERKGDSFSIRGISESSQKISDFMRSLAKSEWFAEPNLKTVVGIGSTGSQRFHLTVKSITEPNKVEEKK